MGEDPRSMLRALAELAAAGGWAASEVMRRYAELSLRNAERFSQELLAISREPDRPGASALDRIALVWVSEYRDYMRELAASPFLLSVGVFEHLERLRRAGR